MNDRAISLLEQYDIEVNATRKGRGAILCDTNKGCLIFKEYQGDPQRLQVQNQLLEHLWKVCPGRTETLLATKEDALYVKDQDGFQYILKTYRDFRECNIRDQKECIEAVEQLALLHEDMELEIPEGEKIPRFSQEKEYEKRNRELKKVRKYLQQRGQKTYFEINLLKSFDYFLDQALQVSEGFHSYQQEMNHESDVLTGGKMAFCHGDYQYHNILFDGTEWYIINFEKCFPDNPIRDLHLILRKLLEKNNWSPTLGNQWIDAYEKLQPLSALSRIDLYYRLSYPEKFWKIVNFYYNTRKSFIPAKNQEKLDKLLAQEVYKKQFLQQVF